MPASSKKYHKNKNNKSDEVSKLNKSSKQPFKPNPTKNKNEQRNDDAVSSKETALRLEDDEPAFPRGGGSSLSRKEREEVRAEAEAEFEAEENQSSAKEPNKKKKRNALQSRIEKHEEDDAGSLFGGGGISGKLPRQANKITLKNVAPGMKLWGVVAEVAKRDIVISLPGGLRGLVRASDAFDTVLDGGVKSQADETLSSMFREGQLVACVVLKVDEDNRERGKRKIFLSLRLSLLNKGYTFDSIQEGMVLTAYVKSIEDHGYILDFGLPSFTGFLPKKSKSEFPGVTMNIGQLAQGIVKTVDKTRKVVHLNPDLETVSKHVTKDLKGISIDLLVPGMMVTAGVQSTLENGVLFSFLTYFTGTVGIFHLQNSFATTNWQDDYSKNKKVNARILFIDPASRAIGLTLNQHLVNNKCPPSHVQIGDIYEKAKVIRVDKGLGLLLETPSIPEPTPTYVSKYEVDETEFRKFEKRFKAGSCLRVRILGFRSLEGVATGTSKANSFEGSVYTHSDAVPGMIVRGKIIAVDPFGAIVQFPGGIKAKCPLPHMSELEISKPGKKFVVGTELVFRVLGGKSKRLTVTHKKSLVKSKLPIISSYTEATDGLITHGWITKIEKHGCFVRFYNGIQGFASRSELEMEPGRDPSSIYHVGQVVKCRIVKCLPSARRINISFIITPTRAAEDDVIQVGSIVPGVVDITTENSVIVYVNGKKHLKGTIYTEHLADHQGQATLMKSVIKPGYEFDQLLLLDIESNNMIFSAKHSLIKSSDKLPLDFSQIRPNTDVHGYVCNIIESGCFVRFLGRLTGFVPRSKAVDDSQLELLNAFYVGQSVLSNIIDVNRETSRVTLSLKRSSFSSTDASFLQEFFLMEEKIAKLQSSESDDSEADWTQGCSVGCRVKAKVQEVKDIGVVVSFDNYNDVLGYITHYQLAGKTIEMGSTVKASVLDLSKTDNLVDLSLKPELLNKSKEKSSLSRSHKKKRQREASKELEIHQTVNAIVEIVKDNYLVVSIPENDYAIGYVSILDYNSQRFPQKQFLNGQSVIATVVALPSPSTIGRLLLLLKSSSSDASNSKKAKQKSSYKVGSLIQAEITEIRALDLRLKFGTGLHGWVHITEINEDNAAETPFSNFKVGQAVKARIIGIKSDANKRGSQFELSMSPSVLTDSFKIEGSHPAEELDFPSGQCVSGYVDKVDSEWVWITITRNLRAQIYILDSSSEPSELKEFMGRYHVGQRVSGYVLSVNKDKKLLRLVPQPFQSLSDKCSDVNICEGCVLGGRVSKILPGIGGLVVKVGPHTYGRVHFTEIADSWVPDPLSGYSEGQFVKCKVLEIKNSITGSLQIDLSLRSSVREVVNNEKIPMNHVEKIEDLHPDMVVQGYIKNTTPKGCFIFLSRKLDARILLSNLSDGYVEDLEKDFPIGRLVTGRVLSTEPLSKRVEVTLKTVGLEKSTGTRELSSLNIGDIVLGRVKQVEKYGLFISIDDTNLVGLCHKSELLDDTPITEYTGGERVKAKVLKIDQEKNRVALGMKDIYEIDDSGADESEDDLKIGVDGPLNMLEDEDMIVDSGSLEAPLAQAESRAFVPPLEVTLDDINQEDLVDQSQGPTDTLDDKAKRRGDKKSKKQREKEIKIAEERLLEKDIPRTSEEFEKLVRGSPNSSFVWIKYMAFALSMAEVDKARSIAERALQTINIREENEKLNIWVAYFNLENEFGNPPEEAVQKVFQRALQYNDPKRVHLSLLGVYERTEKFSLADELVEKMTKKFKHSCKVWLRRVQRLLNPEEDTVQPIVNRALLSLPRHKHIKFISQTALLQYKSGVPHRGRTMFEGILREYPKRTDLWSMYIDQEVRVGDVDVIHALFERATCLRLPAKKMKFLFKKYLEYEKAQGDEERVEYVKKKAMEYVESTLAA